MFVGEIGIFDGDVGWYEVEGYCLGVGCCVVDGEEVYLLGLCDLFEFDV